jgi:cytidine deaminase
MLKSDHSGISEIIAVRDNGEIVPPCGRCREMMMQIMPKNNDTLVYI